MRRLTHKCPQCGKLYRLQEIMHGICAGTQCAICNVEMPRHYPEPKKERKGNRWTWMEGVHVIHKTTGGVS